MASPQVVSVDWGDVVTTTAEARSGVIADNFTNNNALLFFLKRRGNHDDYDGGREIMQELAYAQNESFQWYSGFEALNISLNDTMTAARFPVKQCSIAVVLSGLEMVQNSGINAKKSLIKERMKIAEGTFWNQMSAGVYSDGTAFGGKQLGGLATLISKAPTTGIVGGIDAGAQIWWRNLAVNNATDAIGAASATTLQAYLNKMCLGLKRSTDGVDLIVMDTNFYSFYLASLQAQQRITDSGEKGTGSGFTSLKYYGAGKAVDIILDGGKGGQIPANTAYFINTEFINYRPSSERNFRVVGGDRANVNQDAIVRIIVWAGGMTVSNRSLQGVLF
jgi:hypothetical protein